jgi:predicted phage baseplate assembly protein
MPLPAPDLDDRRFQQLVDDAKRLVQQRCPEWTDHNVSDPGVTLIELFAWMTDQLVYRLNRVPDRHYIRFLDLIGVHRYPATAARLGVTFWLSGSLEQPLTIPRDTQVSTPFSDVEDAVVFATTDELTIPPRQLIAVRTGRGQKETYDQSDILKGAAPFDAFSEVPKPGETLLFGLDDAAPSCAIELTLDCRIEGVGVDPEQPPLLWEAWTGDDWVACDLEHDRTGGLNRSGAVVLHLPAEHTASIIEGQRGGWVRCRVLTPEELVPAYTASPEITRVGARTVGGTVTAVNAVEHTDEILGLSEGVPGQRFELEHHPVLGGEGPLVLEVAAGPGWQRWEQVESFADRTATDPVFVLDELSGEVVFGPGLRLADGRVAQYGAVPPKGAPIRVPRYRTGGGHRGNVAARTVSQLLSAIAMIDRVTNRRAAAGGVDVESMEDARERGPIVLRSRNRAVTTEDYEHLAKEVAPEVARVRCVPITDGEDAGAARVLIVPAVAGGNGLMRFDELIPADETLARIAAYLDDRRTIGARVVVEPPLYQGVTIVARVRAKPTANVARLQQACLAALNAYFHPTQGGPDRTGWPFGRPIHVGEVYAVLQGVEGTEYVEETRLFAADPVTGERGDPTDRIDLEPHALVFSYEHRIRVEAAHHIVATS